MERHTTNGDCPERGLMGRIRSGALTGDEREGLARLVSTIALCQRTIMLGDLPPSRAALAWLPVVEQFAVLLPAFHRRRRP